MAIEPVVAITASALASLVWLVVLVAVAAATLRRVESRASFVAMAVTAFMASIGTLASAVGFANQVGAITLDISPETLTLIASMGRGALLAAGIIVLSTYHPARSGTK